MARSRRLTDGTRWRTFMRLLRLDDLMTSYTNAGAPDPLGRFERRRGRACRKDLTSTSLAGDTNRSPYGLPPRLRRTLRSNSCDDH